MKTNKYKALFVVIFTTIILTLITKQVSAININTVYMDSVILWDSVIICNIYDSIKVVPPSDCGNIKFWRIEYFDYNPYTLYDSVTIYSDTLYIPADFNVYADIDVYDEIDYCGKCTLKPLLLEAEDKSGVCGSLVQLNAYSNYYGSGNATFSWSPFIGLSDTTIPNPTTRATGDMVYTVTVKEPKGCSVSKNVNVTLQTGSSPSICLVSVDSTNKNTIYWEKPVSVAIDSFFIYKETKVTNVYKRIGATGYDDNSFYIDAASSPLIQSNKYKISLKDSCDFESDKSPPHKTIHLTINQGQSDSWNLIWEHYEGFEVPTYYIYRGTNSKNLQIIGSTSGSSSQYTDFTAPVGFVFYQIEVVCPTVCNYSDLKST